MNASSASGPTAHQWYARPVFFVTDLRAALTFYLDGLGFEKRWHSSDGAGTVCQVERGGCEIILSEEPEHRDRTRLFVELNRAGMDGLRRKITERSLPFEKAWWGYDVIRMADPDGNELLFPIDGTNDSERAPNAADA